jgi:hypothetical protein
MTGPEFLGALRARGIRVRVVGDRLRLAPPEAVDAELLEETRRLKPELLRLLTPELTAPAECAWCSGPLTAYLVDLAGTPGALLCRECRRWTLVRGQS